uniref:Uncharacterized protein n=1 Tax=Anguilla anguilla TaxID=7936 RepID=A0A0E9R152_ANGAN
MGSNRPLAFCIVALVTSQAVCLKTFTPLSVHRWKGPRRPQRR